VATRAAISAELHAAAASGRQAAAGSTSREQK
jgi:hypothetical protein